ncbi:MAG: UvrD-helicase domain-containing protein [Defluviitaleaceae bacterium]|nr:UvrD-helicase domain-containing protein [Defluviitaleaceae bacterium]
MDFTKDLNEMQREAVLHTEGALLVIAGAGSGKTRVITHRMAHIINMGVSPHNLLAITFTNKAAKEMRERVTRLIPDAFDCHVSTFHSFCAYLLRHEITHLGYKRDFTIYDTDDTKKLMKSIIKEMDISKKIFSASEILRIIGRLKDEMIGADNYPLLIESGDWYKEIVAQIYKKYQQRLFISNALDFDDLIFKAVELFTKYSNILKRYRERFKYIMIDEYQDTNSAQYQLVRLLSGVDGNICVVGDDDQSIYGWRGANIRNIIDFGKDYQNARSIKLERNYRSAARILDAANAVIVNNTIRQKKKLWTNAPPGEFLEFHNPKDERSEANLIYFKISDALKKGAKLSDFAVLYRTNAQSRPIEDALLLNNIPYRIFGGIRFYDRREIKDILAYLRAVVNLDDDISLMRIINVPKRNIGKTVTDFVENLANAREISFFDALNVVKDSPENPARSTKIQKFLELMAELKAASETMGVSEFISHILTKTGYDRALAKEDKDEETERLHNAYQFINKAVEFERDRDEDDTSDLSAFLENVALIADIDEHKDDGDYVSLMTLHSSKGLEFPVVFMPGLEEGLFPLGKFSPDNSDQVDDEEDDDEEEEAEDEQKIKKLERLEEERRLCYVGITRARERLIISTSEKRMVFGHTCWQKPSRFIDEIPAELFGTSKSIEVVTPQKTPETRKTKIFDMPKYSPQISAMPKPKTTKLVYEIGEMVKSPRYGVGEIVRIDDGGADYEISVNFEGIGIKKFMSGLAKLVKVSKTQEEDK